MDMVSAVVLETAGTSLAADTPLMSAGLDSSVASIQQYVSRKVSAREEEEAPTGTPHGWVLSFGYNGTGQLGHGDVTHTFVPTRMVPSGLAMMDSSHRTGRISVDRAPRRRGSFGEGSAAV